MTVAPATSSTLPWQPVRRPTPRWWRSWPRAWPAASTNRACAPAPACRPSARWPSNPASVVSPWWKHTTGWSLAGWCSRGAERVFRARPQRPLAAVAPAAHTLAAPARVDVAGCAACSAKPPSTACRAAPACCRRTGWIPKWWRAPCARWAGRCAASSCPTATRRVSAAAPADRRIAAGRGRARPSRAQSADHQWRHARAGPDRAAPVKPGDTVLVEDPAGS